MTFSPDYFAARERFRRAAAELKLTLEAHPLSARGPQGQELTIDVATTGAGEDTAPAVLLVTSGLHGIEGFFGSAVQGALLEQFRTTAPLPAGVRLVLVHALNPFGFAWQRRGDADNVDLNRNLLLPHEAYAGAPTGYEELDGLLNPRQPPARWEPFFLKALWVILRRGMPTLKQAIAAGQYEFPQGLFFGGKGPSELLRILQGNLRRWLGNARRVLHLDFHTGLGKWATYKLLLDAPVSAAQEALLRAHFGSERVEVSDKRGIAFAIRGGIGTWCAATFPEVDWLYLCAEFGTYAPVAVLAGLRAENQAHHWARAADASTLRAKARLKELFCPSSEKWRSRVLTESLSLARQGLDYLKSKPIVE